MRWSARAGTAAWDRSHDTVFGLFEWLDTTGESTAARRGHGNASGSSRRGKSTVSPLILPFQSGVDLLQPVEGVLDRHAGEVVGLPATIQPRRHTIGA